MSYLCAVFLPETDGKVADFAFHADTVPDMYEHVNLNIVSGKERIEKMYVVENRVWDLGVVDGHVSQKSCKLYLAERE